MSTFFSHGLHQGHTTTSSIKVWGRFSPKIDTVVVMRLFENGDVVDFKECAVVVEQDCTFAVEFTGLQSATEYEVQGSYLEEHSAKFPFRTDSAVGDLHFVFGSCRYNHWDNVFQDDGEAGDETFKQILLLHEQEPLDGLFLIGDQIYADPTFMVGVSESFEDFTSTYQDSFAFANFQKLLQKVPSLMLLDDHEIRNNWSQDMLIESTLMENRDEMYKNGIKSYECWQHSRNPTTPAGQYWYDFEKKDRPFFFMDVRTNRWLKPKKGLRKTTLGDEQLSAFLNWLASTKEQPIRFVASGIPFFPDTLKEEDKWDAFDEERRLILEFMRVEGIGKTVFLSGDVHMGVFAQMHCLEDDAVQLINLTSSPLYWPYPGMKREDFFEEKVLAYNQYDCKSKACLSEYHYQYSCSHWLRENQFCEVKIKSSGEGMARHFNMKSGQFEGDWHF